MDLKLFPKKNFFFLLFRGIRIIFFVVFVRGSRKTKYLSKCFLICFLYPALHLLFSAQQRNFSCLIFHHAEHNKHEFNLSITEVFFVEFYLFVHHIMMIIVIEWTLKCYFYASRKRSQVKFKSTSQLIQFEHLTFWYFSNFENYSK